MSRFPSGTSVLKGLRDKHPGDVEFAPPEDMLKHYMGNVPLRRCLDEAS
jgi:hypothetical protein